MTKEQAALEAERLAKDTFFIHALALMRSEALEALARTDPDDGAAIRTHQATIRVIDDFDGIIVSAIRNAKPPKAAGIV